MKKLKKLAPELLFVAMAFSFPVVGAMVATNWIEMAVAVLLGAFLVMVTLLDLEAAVKELSADEKAMELEFRQYAEAQLSKAIRTSTPNENTASYTVGYPNGDEYEVTLTVSDTKRAKKAKAKKKAPTKKPAKKKAPAKKKK